MTRWACRHCGATGRDQEDPNKRCGQCDGAGSVQEGKPNPIGPGVKRLVEHAQAVGPKGGGAAYMFLHERANTPELAQLVEDITRVYPRRNRMERRRYAKLALQAMRLGILVRVPEVPEAT